MRLIENQGGQPDRSTIYDFTTATFASPQLPRSPHTATQNLPDFLAPLN
jgi:hypothetical protein